MGQQQYLYLIITVVIIGIATYVAVASVSKSSAESAREAIQIELLEALGHAQAYFQKSSSMGGGGRSFLNISLQDMNLPATTADGDYAFYAENRNLTLVGENSGFNLRVEAYAWVNSSGDMQINWTSGPATGLGNGGNGGGNGNSGNTGNGGNGGSGNSGNNGNNGGNGNKGNNGNKGV